MINALNGAQTKSADRHCIADQREHLGRYKFGICKIADRDVLCPEVEILGTAEEGIPVLAAVLRLEAAKSDLVSLDEAFDLHPQLALGGQQIDCCHQCEVFLVELADGLVESQAVFFVSEVHR